MRCNRFRVFLLHWSEVLENEDKWRCNAFTKIRCPQNVLYVTRFFAHLMRIIVYWFELIVMMT